MKITASIRKNCRRRSSASLYLPSDGVENGFEVNFQNGGIGLVTSIIGGHGVRTAQNNVHGSSAVRACAHAVGTVSRRIRWAKNGDGRRSKRDSQMQRSSITTDDAGRVAQKSHELAERAIVSDGLGFPTG